MLKNVVVLALISLLAVPALSQLNGYEALTDWEALSWSKSGLDSELFSSYDRTGGNTDYSYYLTPSGHQTGEVSDALTAEVSGPGVLRRFWMPHSASDRKFDLRVYVDGLLIFDTDSNDYLAGNIGYVDDTLTTTLIGGQTSYEPIVFQDSLVVESNNFPSIPGISVAAWKHYYQHSVHHLPAGAATTPTTGTLSPLQLSARNQAIAVVQALGDNPAGSSGSSVLEMTSAQSIAPGSSLAIASPVGGGKVRALNLLMNSATDAELDGLRLRVRYDGGAENAIDIPVSQFFGVGAGRADYKSLPLGVANDGSFYSYWPMPFRDGVIIDLYNPTGQSIDIDSASVEIESGAVAPQSGYLHAVYQQETTVASQTHHELLDIEGKGHYVGNLLWLELPNDRRNILEGDDIVTVDGTQVLYGTGLEDAYNGGYYYNHVAIRTTDGDIANPESGTGAFSGLLRMDFDTLGDSQTRTDQYRWLITDPVAFDQSINVKIENFDNRANVQFGSTVFYYLVDAAEGDMDGDGDVDQDDYDLIDQALFGQARAGDRREGDTNNDGYVNMIDLQAVLANWTDGDVPSGLLGDVNGDGVITNGDISAFVLALTDPSAYADAYSGLDPAVLADFNHNDAFTNGDIAGFIAALTGGGTGSLHALGAVPEPGTLGMLGLVGLIALRRRAR